MPKEYRLVDEGAILATDSGMHSSDDEGPGTCILSNPRSSMF